MSHRNAKIHRAELIQPFLEKHKKTLTFMYLPPYSPNRNIIEEVQGFIRHINETPSATVERLCLQF
ncbi:MAG: hypothetical protein K0R57_4726 [Paenibacillaceae bacterium]|jgi:hypothetical protein|nr:hypothetical protein [Paenibacillaceae bacterium]